MQCNGWQQARTGRISYIAAEFIPRSPDGADIDAVVAAAAVVHAVSAVAVASKRLVVVVA